MKVFFIPCAKRITSDMEIKFGLIPSVMIPINKEPLLKKLYNLSKDSFDHIFVLTYKNSRIIDEYLSLQCFDKIKTIELDKLSDIGYTINFGINFLKEQFNLDSIENITINFGDTLIEDYNYSNNENLISFSDSLDHKRWTTFEYEDDNILQITDKSDNNINRNQYQIFNGLFSFKDVTCLSESLQKALGLLGTLKEDSFYHAIKLYNSKYGFHFFNSKAWLDLGHADKYMFKSENDSRFFNSIKIDKKRGILTKTSENWKKLSKEITWYRKLPDELKYLIPNVLDFRINSPQTFVTLEYYSYPTLQEIYAFGNYTLDKWKMILDSVFFVLDEFNHAKRSFPQQEIKESLHEMYSSKTKERIQEYRNNKDLAVFFHPIVINKIEYKSIDFYASKIDTLIEEYGLYDLVEFNPIHGDFCFSNLLYDPTTNIIRLIDPRGSFGKFDIYGDPRYEYAKLSHCLNGRYDLIINDLFNIEIDKNEVSFNVKQSYMHEGLKSLFFNYIENKGLIKDQILLIESLLFISMVPLHNGEPLRQSAMLCTSLMLIDNLYKKSNIEKYSLTH